MDASKNKNKAVAPMPIAAVVPVDNSDLLSVATGVEVAESPELDVGWVIIDVEDEFGGLFDNVAEFVSIGEADELIEVVLPSKVVELPSYPDFH